MENILWLLASIAYTYFLFQLGRAYGRTEAKRKMQQDFLNKVNEFFRVPKGHVIDGVHFRRLEK